MTCDCAELDAAKRKQADLEAAIEQYRTMLDQVSSTLRDVRTQCPHRLGVSGAWPCALDAGHDGAHVARSGEAALTTYRGGNYECNPINPKGIKYGAVPVGLLRQVEAERDDVMSVTEVYQHERNEARAEVERLRVHKAACCSDNEEQVARLREALREIARPKRGGIEANDSDEDWIEYLRRALEREQATARAALGEDKP